MWECTDRKCDRTKAGGIINMCRFFCEIELFKSSDHLKIKVAGFFDQVTKVFNPQNQSIICCSQTFRILALKFL